MWVKEHYIDTCKPKKYIDYQGDDGEIHQMGVPEVYIDPDTGQSRCFVPATVYDNPALMVNDPAYERRLQALEDMENIKKLKAKYCYYCDDNYDADALASLFSEDAVVYGPRLRRCVGREAIRKNFEKAPKLISFAVHMVMAFHSLNLKIKI